MPNTVKWPVIAAAAVALLAPSFSSSQADPPPIVVSTIEDLQKISLSGSYSLGGDIDATKTLNWNGGRGFLPIGTSTAPFTGTLEGNGHTITGLFINSTSTTVPYVGLLGRVGLAGLVEDVNLVNANISGNTSRATQVGGLVGHLDGEVYGCTLSGSVTGLSATYLGGLVGYSDGTISGSSTNINVVNAANYYTGGLVGFNIGDISDSNSAGSIITVKGLYVGGLVGLNKEPGSISDSRSSASVVGASKTRSGGLVGANTGIIIASVATGAVSAPSASYVGGLVGENYSGLIWQSYATGSAKNGSGGFGGGLVGYSHADGGVFESLATGPVGPMDALPPVTGGYEGGLVGYNATGGMIYQSYATGAVSGNKSSSIGGLVGVNSASSIIQSYSVGAVKGPFASHSGGLVGYKSGGTATSSYWDTDTSSLSTLGMGTGKPTAYFQSGKLPMGFGSASWSAQSGMNPYLSWLGPAPVTEYINPKYLVVGVTYNPPGQPGNSFVQYLNTSFVGNTQTLSASFNSSHMQSFNISLAGGVQSVFEGTISAGPSSVVNQTTKDSSTVTTSISVQNGEKTFSNPTPLTPVNHDYDLIWVWLNPAVIYTLYGNTSYETNTTVQWNGYGFDSGDQPDADIVQIPLGYLNGDFGPIPASIQNSIKRGWAASQAYGPGDGPALNSSDLAQIASADPFSAITYGPTYIGDTPPSPGTADSRFRLSPCTQNSTIPYQQAAPSQNAPIFTCTLTNVNLSTQEQDITNSFSQTFSIDKSFTVGYKYISLKAAFKNSYTLTWTTQSQKSSTNTTTATAMLSVQGPPCNNLLPGLGPCVPVYDASGDQPTQFQVYQDNMYGSFMFAPIGYYP